MPRKNFLVFMILSFVACSAPSIRSSGSVGVTDHSGDQGNVGSNDQLTPPSSLVVLNNGTGSEKYLRLQWNAVPSAVMYTVYRAVYPTHAHPNGTLADKAYKKLVEIPAGKMSASTITYHDEIPHLPLRRYSYMITAGNEYGESSFSNPVDAYRVPIDAEEALLDIDYSIHFAQCGVPNFGNKNLDITVKDRPKAGTYHYASKVFPPKIQSRFSNYGDFETILTTGNGFKMDINWNPLGTKMDGPINASGLYNASITYHNFVGIEGGYSRSGSITITYQHPEKGQLKKDYSFEEARRLMKTVAYNSSEKQPRPPASEWDEADPSYTRIAREIAKRSVLSTR